MGYNVIVIILILSLISTPLLTTIAIAKPYNREPQYEIRFTDPNGKVLLKLFVPEEFWERTIGSPPK